MTSHLQYFICAAVFDCHGGGETSSTTSNLQRIFEACSSVSQSHSSSVHIRRIRSEYGVTPYSVQHRGVVEYLEYL